MLAEGGPVLIADKAGKGIECMYRGQVRIGYFAEDTFESRDTEGDAGGLTDVHAQLFKVIAFPFRAGAALPFGFNEPKAFFEINSF